MAFVRGWLCSAFALAIVSVEAKGKGGLYAFNVRNINNEETSLEAYRGKISLVVNVASECGYTDEHYKHMAALYNDLAIDKKEPFTVLAFPCNQFGNQEPYENSVVLEFAQTTYGVKFPIFGKTNVAGHDADPLFGYLTRNSGKEPKWNFWKYLIDERGAVIGAWGPRTTVMDIKDDIMKAINNLKAKDHKEL